MNNLRERPRIDIHHMISYACHDEQSIKESGITTLKTEGTLESVEHLLNSEQKKHSIQKPENIKAVSALAGSGLPVFSGKVWIFFGNLHIESPFLKGPQPTLPTTEAQGVKKTLQKKKIYLMIYS